MKLSISVPDELWERACPPGRRASAVVQDALAAYVDREHRVPFDRAPNPDLLEGLLSEGALSKEIERLMAEARSLRALGYAIGIEAAPSVSWVDLESLPPAEALTRYVIDVLLRVANREDVYLSGVVTAIRDAARGYGEVGVVIRPDGTQEDHMGPPSLTLVRGVVDALHDVRDAVRARLADTADSDNKDAK